MFDVVAVVVDFVELELAAAAAAAALLLMLLDDDLHLSVNDSSLALKVVTIVR